MFEPPFTQDEYDAAAARITELAAYVNAAQAKLAQHVADFDDRRMWFGYGINTCQHWLTINTGLNPYAAEELMRVGHALRELPKIRESFERGELSLDKARLLTRVAVAADEEIWLGMALQASGAQLGRIVRGYERSSDDRENAHERRAGRGLWVFWRTDGLLDLRATLTADDGALVLKALDAVAERIGTPSETPEAILRRGGTMAQASAAGLDPALFPPSSRRVDALTELCTGVLTGATAEGVARNAAHRVVVHVDLAALTGEDPKGRSQIETGPGISAEVARRIGCDAEVVAVAELDGKPIDVGRRRRTPSARLRLAIQSRDGGCAFPGCMVRDHRHLQVHHITHWAHGGLTEERNLLSMCAFHHGRHHDGAFTIELDAKGRPVFRTMWGDVIGRPGRPLRRFGRGEIRRLLVGNADGITADTPVARDHGAHFDFPLAVELLHCNTAHARRLARSGASH